MPDSLGKPLDATRILFELQKSNEIAESFSGLLNPEEIARRTTEGLVVKFNSAMARLWLLEQVTLKLVASSGLHTSINGSFSKVPIGAYKVGKIAQNRVAFFSNNLPAESWVGNRQWAIDNNIKGFAGYPLIIKDRVIGVLATFSCQKLTPEFLEVFQSLCTIVAIAINNAYEYQKDKQNCQFSITTPLSDHLASLLPTTRLILAGTEQPLSLCQTYLFLKVTETLNNSGCLSCRLIYGSILVLLEAKVPKNQYSDRDIDQVLPLVALLGGSIESKNTPDESVLQVTLSIPYSQAEKKQLIRICCSSSILEIAYKQVALAIGLQVSQAKDQDIPLLTDCIEEIPTAKYSIWLQVNNRVVPKGIQGKIDLSTTPEELKKAVETVVSGQVWGIIETEELPSERELEILQLLSQGLRDKEVANHLIISESTVKFHINNLLKKLQVKTRYQALYQAIIKGWLG